MSDRVGHRKVDGGNGVEAMVMVNNMVVDFGLGGSEVTVSPSLEKI